MEWGSPDVIHAHVVLPAGWTAVRLGKRYSVPVILTEHSSPFSMHLGTRLAQRLARETLTHADRVIAISPALKEQLLEFEPGLAVTVIGEAVKTDFFVPASDDAPARGGIRSFFVAARLAEQKGLVHLIKAVQILGQRRINSFELIIGGDGPDRQMLEQLVNSLGVAERCHFLGTLDREQVKREMQKCDVFVLSSLHETFGVVVGEAMACGKPVISTRCGGPEFVVTDETGVLVEVANPEALADAMSDFISGRVSFNPSAVRASVVNRFGPTAFLQNITKVYEELW
jgi:glycosyltransferase involved in cell wall biosynthesis